METATQAQINYLTKLQAEYLKDQADGFFTQYESPEAYAANEDLTFIYDAAEHDFMEAVAPTPGQFADEAARQRGIARFGALVDRGVEMLADAKDTTPREWRAALRDMQVALRDQVRAVAAAERWQRRCDLDAAARVDLEGLTKVEASRLIDLLK